MNKQIVTRGLALLLALLLALSALSGCGQSPAPGSSAASAVSAEAAAEKSITLTVVHKDGSEKEIALTTKEQYLGAALEAEGIIAGEEGQYGLFIKTADGETADESNQEWWCLTKEGEMTETGVDSTEFTDGDKFELTLKVAY